MRPKERRLSGDQDLFRSRLDQIIDLDHALAKLARAIDWGFLEEKFGAAYSDKPGHPPLPTRLMAGLAILKHSYDLSDEGLCDRWVENPYFQFFCGEEFFQHRLVFDRSSLARWRQRMGEEKLVALIEGGHVPDRCKAERPRPHAAGAAGPKARCRAAPVLSAGRQAGADQAPALRPRQAVQARQQGAAQAQDLSRPHHARHRPQDRRQRGPASGLRAAALSRRAGAVAAAPPARAQGLLAARAGSGMHHQRQGPQALRARRQGQRRHHGGAFGRRPVRTHAAALPGNPCDGHTLAKVVPAIEALLGNMLDRIVTDAGYRGHNAPPEHRFHVYTAGQKRGVTDQIKRDFKRRAAIEPVMGHLKDDHRMGRCHLAHAAGDAINAVLAAAGYNFRRLIRWLRLLLCKILTAISPAVQLNPA